MNENTCPLCLGPKARRAKKCAECHLSERANACSVVGVPEDGVSQACRLCGHVKALDAFRSRPGMRNGVRSECKDCQAAHAREIRGSLEIGSVVTLTCTDEHCRSEFEWVVTSGKRAKFCPDCRQFHRRRNDALRHRPEYQKRRARMRRYGLTVEQYDFLLESQGGRCAVCRSHSPGPTENWHIDHDHRCCDGNRSCGKCVRGLLCQECNARVLPVLEKCPKSVALLATLDSNEPMTLAAKYLVHWAEVHRGLRLGQLELIAS